MFCRHIKFMKLKMFHQKAILVTTSPETIFSLNTQKHSKQNIITEFLYKVYQNKLKIWGLFSLINSYTIISSIIFSLLSNHSYHSHFEIICLYLISRQHKTMNLSDNRICLLNKLEITGKL